MANPNLIPYCTFWLRRPTNIVASIDRINTCEVNGHIQYGAGGLPIPFEVRHDGHNFQAGGMRFNFKDWIKLK